MGAEYIFLNSIGTFVEWDRHAIHPTRRALLRGYLVGLALRVEGFTPAEREQLKRRATQILNDLK